MLPNNNICNPIVYPDKDTNDFLSMCNDSIQKKKLLPIVDRVNALSLVIKNNPKLIGKVHIAVFCRPDANISFFDACYPKENFDIVFPLDNSTKWDSLKYKKFKNVFLREIYTVKPDFFTHNSDIIKTGRFKELLDPSAYEYYVKHKIALK
ncbi:hypothetical protein F5ESL0233_04145 [Lactobacillus sp. ESL0233]|uniref:hypothetical protein n=1 Tax=Lactobacillus sp. ESL0233 TaxID=2069354 RepID=UPI000EFCEE03|nr:hypothetical protein [Lactobacillus sp. ESL0233]RMC41525.1 hypothetical protein F5ESL0233_04145 [Lactobacillus sp. ESL0233]